MFLVRLRGLLYKMLVPVGDGAMLFLYAQVGSLEPRAPKQCASEHGLMCVCVCVCYFPSILATAVPRIRRRDVSSHFAVYSGTTFCSVFFLSI